MGEGGAYNQTYVVFKNIIANQTLEPLRRDVFFRFGRWCYAGNVEIGTETLQLSDVPLVAPILQSQQSKLKYFCLSADIPSTSSFYDPMERMREVNAQPELYWQLFETEFIDFFAFCLLLSFLLLFDFKPVSCILGV